MRSPDEDDWGKLKRVLRYVWQTIKLPLILREEIITVKIWWVDTSYTAHPDMIGNTGASILFLRGSVTGIAKKHNINAKSSREVELIGDDNAMPQMLHL